MAVLIQPSLLLYNALSSRSSPVYSGTTGGRWKCTQEGEMQGLKGCRAVWPHYGTGKLFIHSHSLLCDCLPLNFIFSIVDVSTPSFRRRMLAWHEQRDKMWTSDPMSHPCYSHGFFKPWYSWEVMGVQSTNIWLSSTIHLSYTFQFEMDFCLSFINIIRWHKDTQSSCIKDHASTSPYCSAISPRLRCTDKHVAVTDCCTSAEPSCLLFVDNQGEVIYGSLAHSEREGWSQLPHSCRGPRRCTGSALQRHYNLLAFSTFCGSALVLIKIFINTNELNIEKGNNYRYLLPLYLLFFCKLHLGLTLTNLLL